MFCDLFNYFLSLKNDANVPSKCNKQRWAKLLFLGVCFLLVRYHFFTCACASSLPFQICQCAMRYSAKAQVSATCYPILGDWCHITVHISDIIPEQLCVSKLPPCLLLLPPASFSFFSNLPLLSTPSPPPCPFSFFSHVSLLSPSFPPPFSFFSLRPPLSFPCSIREGGDHRDHT
jgi:hypothetical protein